MTLQEEITRRRTFAIISHPDAGKTTLTEKLLLFGGAIHVAGAVKSNKIKKGATSDFMEIERQRGISVATSVMGFEYNGVKINILDTPGHEDFAEDTYRTLTAVDSVIIVIDGAKGVEHADAPPDGGVPDAQDAGDGLHQQAGPPVQGPLRPAGRGGARAAASKSVRSPFRSPTAPTFKGVYNIYAHGLSLFTSDERQTADGVDRRNPRSGCTGARRACGRALCPPAARGSRN